MGYCTLKNTDGPAKITLLLEHSKYFNFHLIKVCWYCVSFIQTVFFVEIYFWCVYECLFFPYDDPTGKSKFDSLYL